MREWRRAIIRRFGRRAAVSRSRGAPGRRFAQRDVLQQHDRLRIDDLATLDGGWPARAIAVASTVCVMVTRVHALLLIVVGALLLVGVHAIG